jgi:hypothetical protein
MSKAIKDIEDIQGEFKLLDKKISLLEKRFQATALDYTHYIDNSWGQKRIFELRDSVQYRLFSARLHIEIIIRQHYIIEEKLSKLAIEKPNLIFGQFLSANPVFERYEQEISCIFDSIIFHLVSVFDYLSTLINYICGKEDQNTLMWTQLAKSVRDKKNVYSRKSIARLIDELDRNFVTRLYDYRSHLIHKKADFKRYAIEVKLSQKDMIFDARFIATEQFIRHFKELKEESKEFNFTTKYVSFWIMQKTISTITDILFGLKKEMELTKKVPFGMLGLYDEKTKQMKPVSTAFWFESEYHNDKNNC